jgi:hypothetical protein
VDWDYHHGDGTQKIFLDDPNVLTVSLHAGMQFCDRDESSDVLFSNAGDDDYDDDDDDEDDDYDPTPKTKTKTKTNSNSTTSKRKGGSLSPSPSSSSSDENEGSCADGEYLPSPSRQLACCYPGTIHMCADNHGVGDGEGYNINIPWPNTAVGDAE